MKFEALELLFRAAARFIQEYPEASSTLAGEAASFCYDVRRHVERQDARRRKLDEARERAAQAVAKKAAR